MKIIRLALLALCAAVPVGAGAQSAVGIAPTYDGGGDEWGSVFVQNLTLDIFQTLQASKGYVPSLLNPGGVYTPLDPSWLVDYTQDRPDIKLLLVTTLKPVVAPERGKWVISVDVALLDKSSGEARENFVVKTEIKGKDTDLFASYKETNPFKSAFTTGFRTFDKSPLGRAAQRLAESIRDELQARLHVAASAASVAASSGAPCAMKVRITYSYKHAASQAYSLFANGLEESLSVDGGVASFQAPEGPILLQFSVSDAPYKLARQPMYQLSTQHSCSKSMFIVDLGPGGDAHDRWE